MTLRQVLDATAALLEEQVGPIAAAELLVDDPVDVETPEQASARRRADLVAAYGPGVIGG